MMKTHVHLTKLFIPCTGYSAQGISQFGNPFVFVPFNGVPQWHLGTTSSSVSLEGRLLLCSVLVVLFVVLAVLTSLNT